MPTPMPRPPGNAQFSHLYNLKSLKNLTRTRQHPLVKELLDLEKEVASNKTPNLSRFISDVARGVKLCFPNYMIENFDSKKYIEIFSTPDHNLEEMINKPSTLIIRNGKYYIEVEGPQNRALLPSEQSPMITATCDVFATSGLPLSSVTLQKISVSQGLLAGTQKLFMQEKGMIGTTPIILDENAIKQLRYIKDDAGNCELHAVQLCYTVKPHMIASKNPYAFYYKNARTQETQEIIDDQLYDAISDAIRAQMASPTITTDNNILQVKYKGKILEIEPLISVQNIIDLSGETPEIDMQTQINIHPNNIKIVDELFNPYWVPVFNFTPLPHTVAAYQWRTQETMTPEEIQMQKADLGALQAKINQQQTLTTDEQLAYDTLTTRFEQIVADCKRDAKLCLPCCEEDFIEIEVHGTKQRFALQGSEKTIEIPREEDIARATTSHFVNMGMPLSTVQLLKVGHSQGLLALPFTPLLNLKYAGQSVTPSGSIKTMHLSKYEYLEDNAPQCQFDATQFFYYLLDPNTGKIYYKNPEKPGLQETEQYEQDFNCIKNAIEEVNSSAEKKKKYFFAKDTQLALKRETLEQFATIEPLFCLRTHVEFGKSNDPTSDYTVEYDLFQPELSIDDPQLSPIALPQAVEPEHKGKIETALSYIPSVLSSTPTVAIHVASQAAATAWSYVPSFRRKPTESKEPPETQTKPSEPTVTVHIGSSETKITPKK